MKDFFDLSLFILMDKKLSNFQITGVVYDRLLENIRPEILPQMQQILFDFITGVMPYNIACQKSIATCGNCEAIDKLMIFMNVSEEPIPFDKDNQQKAKSWSQYEDQRLIAGVHKFGTSEWSKVSQFVGNGRNRCQCGQRWSRSLNPTINKTLWNQIEDLKLIHAVNQFGDKSWTKIADVVKGRSDLQCKYRYQLIAKKYLSDLSFQKNLLQKTEVKKEVPETPLVQQKPIFKEYPAPEMESDDTLKFLDWIEETPTEPVYYF